MKLFLAAAVVLAANAAVVLGAPSDDAVVIEAAGCNKTPPTCSQCKADSGLGSSAKCVSVLETIAGETCYNCCCEEAPGEYSDESELVLISCYFKDNLLTCFAP